MGILLRSPAGWIDSRAEEVDRKLRDGDPGTGWRGDPRLELRIGRVTDQFQRVRKDPMTGEPLERYEVWRDCSDTPIKPHPKWGLMRRIGTWKLGEVERIIYDLIGMDPRTPGSLSAVDKVARMEAENEAAQDRAMDEALGPIIEHQLALLRDRDTKHFHGQAGVGEGKVTRQQRRAQERAAAKAAR